MRKPLFPVAAAAAILSLASAPAAGQVAPTDPAGAGELLDRLEKPGPKGPAPRTPDGKPDLSGIWGADRNFMLDISATLKPGETLPLQPWAERVAKERMSKDDPEANCLPTGVPRQ